MGTYLNLELKNKSERHIESVNRLWNEENPGAEICGEPGMACTGCISERDLAILGIESMAIPMGRQRPECKCLAVKRELLSRRGQCASGCLYCYWK